MIKIKRVGIYRAVSKAFPPDERQENLPFSHYERKIIEMNEIKMYYHEREIIITEVAGMTVRIRRVDDGLFKTVSFLRHHRGRTAYAKELLVSVHDIERQA